jgi:hypothetical protein
MRSVVGIRHSNASAVGNRGVTPSFDLVTEMLKIMAAPLIIQSTKKQKKTRAERIQQMALQDVRIHVVHTQIRE